MDKERTRCWQAAQALLYGGIMGLALAACSSSKPTPPKPLPVAAAERNTSQAQSNSQRQNWPAAAREWKLAAETYALLNDRGREAIALHNLAEAEAQTGDLKSARRDFDRAADLNEKLGRREEWWRNQIALLQLDAAEKKSDALRERFERLLPHLGDVKAAWLRGMFLNELGLFQVPESPGKAAQNFARARQEFQSIKNELGLATVTANEAVLAEAEKKYEVAGQRWSSALRQFESLAETRGIAAALAGLGRTTLALGKDLAAAEDYLRRAARNFGLLKSPAKQREALERLAEALDAQGKKQEADAVRGESKALGGKQ